MQNNIEMIENMLNTERRNRRGNREIRFEVNSNYYEAVSKLLSDYKRVLEINEVLLKENEELKANCIPIQKVKDKIEELDERIKNPEKISYWASYTISECIGIRSILQELLEEGE